MIEIADVFRRFAADYVGAHGASLLASHHRAIEDILACRTAALGGQVWRCELSRRHVLLPFLRQSRLPQGPHRAAPKGSHLRWLQDPQLPVTAARQAPMDGLRRPSHPLPPGRTPA